MHRAPGFQREYESRAAVNTVVLHPNQVIPESSWQAAALQVNCVLKWMPWCGITGMKCGITGMNLCLLIVSCDRN